MSYFDSSSSKFVCNLDRTSINNHETEECDTGGDVIWSPEAFDENLQVKVIKNDNTNCEIEVCSIDAPIVNAIRRVIMSEVPTMAIEKVFISDNTTIFQDDFLAHRLGLIPIKADPLFFEYRNEGDQEGTSQDTIELALKIKCVKNPEASKETGVTDLYLNRSVYSGSITWVPLGNQADLIKEPIKTVNDDILIAKMSPGQALDLKLHCVKGIGRDHAKFSPVATVYYRLMPTIKLKKPVIGADAKLLQSCFSKGVIKIKKTDSGEDEAVVANARDDTLSRNFYRYKQFEDVVQMGLKKDHFIFNIESTGILTTGEIIREAMEILLSKCNNILREVEEYKESMAKK